MRRPLISGLLLVLFVLPLVAQPRSTMGPETEWSLAAVGDVIMNRRVASFDQPGDPGFHDMANLIRGADAAFMNLEQSLFRLSEFAGWPEAEKGGNYELGPPEVLQDLKAMGFDLYNRANNHTTDYGVTGLRATNKLLDEMGLVHAGAGENLGWASRPGYLDTPKGRIALIGMASTFTPMSRAGAASPDVMGRPGLNPLRVAERVEASPQTMGLLGQLARVYGAAVNADPSRQVRVLGTTIFPGATDRVVSTVNPDDYARIVREVRNAADQADHVVVNSHSHQSGSTPVTPPEWMVAFAHDVIDAGATTFIIEGPHRLRGIEIYKGRPIFYSLANFFFHLETIDPMPSDIREQFRVRPDALASEIYDARFGVGADGEPTTGYPTESVPWESVLALAKFRGNEVVELRLHPVELNWKAPRSQRGTPRLASGPAGRKIIEELARLSKPFGTDIRYEDGVGVWRATLNDRH